MISLLCIFCTNDQCRSFLITSDQNTLHFFVEIFNCSAEHKHRFADVSDTVKNKITRLCDKNSASSSSSSSSRPIVSDDVDAQEYNEHRQQILNRKIDNIPLEIISPITQIVWLWLCPNWRNKLDFNFQRPPDWNDDMVIHKFNHNKYIKYHNMWDWHDWARLTNQTMIFAGVIINPNTVNQGICYYVTKVEYAISSHLEKIMDGKSKHGRSVKTWDNITTQDYIPDCLVKVKELKYCAQHQLWVLSNREKQFKIEPSFNWTSRDPSVFVGKVIHRVGPDTYEHVELKHPDWQHPDVAANKPFIFGILSFDKYHHTQFSGFNSMNTHGCYWWLGNIDPSYQFTEKYTMITSQAPGIVDFVTIVSSIYQSWEYLMAKGCLLPTPNGMIRVYGMVSHHITDMEDKDALQRHRKCTAGSRCDGFEFNGCKNGVKWPSNSPSLLELHTVVPGPYVLQVLQKARSQEYAKTAYDKILFPMTLTLAKEDVFNDLGIDSTLKSPPEIGHTACLGFLKDIFLFLHGKLHDIDGYDEVFTRAEMIAYLNKYFVGINGRKAFIKDKNTNITRFDQIQHSYRLLVEIMISMPHVCNWDRGWNLFSNLVRFTGCLHTCKSENRRKCLIPICKDICNEGMLFMLC